MWTLPFLKVPNLGPFAEETQSEASVSHLPGFHSPSRQVRQAHGLAVPSYSVLKSVLSIHPFLHDSVPSLKDQLINLLEELIRAQPNTSHKICMIACGPDVWNVCIHYGMKAQNESLEDSCNRPGFAPNTLPGPHDSQCLYFYKPPFRIASLE